MSRIWAAITYSAPVDEYGFEEYPRWVFIALGAVAILAILGL